jgi:hypothetical protein
MCKTQSCKGIGVKENWVLEKINTGGMEKFAYKGVLST